MDHRADVKVAWLTRSTTVEGCHLGDEIAHTLAGFQYFIERVRDLAVVSSNLTLQHTAGQSGETQDARQDVIEVVGDPVGKFADGLHAL